MESSYVGKHAEYYDIFYQDKPYATEAAFVENCLQRFGDGSTQRLLELACGTGGHAFELEKLGYNMVATDSSPDMLASAQRKAEEHKATVDFRLQDMTALDLPEKSFDAAICLFDSIGYVRSNQAINQVLKGVHRHLRPGGLFIFEFWHAAAMLRAYDALRVRRWPIPNGELLRIAETKLEPAKQLAHVVYSIYEHRHDGSYQHLSETQTNRYFLVGEMKAWLHGAGFTPVKCFNGFTEDEGIDENTWHVVTVARRNAA